MQANPVLIWALNIAASLAYASGAVFMKSSAGFQRLWPSILVYVSFIAGASLQTYAMKFQKIGSGYTIVLGLEAVAAIGLGVLLFREQITLGRWIGIGLVLGGVILLRE